MIRRAGCGFAAVALGATVLVGAQGTFARAEPPLTVEDAKAQIEQHEAEAAGLDQEYNDVKLEISDAEKALKEKQQSLQAQRAKIARLKKIVGQVALANLQNKSLGTTAQLFLHANTDRFLSQLSTVEKITQNQNSALQDYQEQQAALVTLEQSASDELESLEKQRDELKKIRKDADKKVKDAEKILDRLTSEQREALAAEERRQSEDSERAAQASDDDSDSDSDDSKSDDSDSDDEDPKVTGSGKGATVLAWALTQKGKPYVFGSDGPDSYDCSGLTLKAWGKVGVSLPHSSSKQFKMGTPVSKDNLRPGDLVFYYSSSRPSHVGIYAGNGQIFHAPNSRKPLGYSPLDSMPYVGARRYG
ncbi:NlpC/P60 family protein [Microlunatus sp. GCM10028923]|uniref:C40 family peptidase n=1 Tax=Microlunatus sp. GCM10028923 TaxID=3273400 RepID=UPI003617D756